MSKTNKEQQNKENKLILKRFIVVVSITLVIAVMAFLMLWSSIVLGIDVQCPLKHIFNIDCPGCGVTRMCKAILKGEIYQAFRYNVLIFITFPIAFIIYLWQSYVYIMHNKLLKYIDSFLIAYAILLIVFGVIRNIPPFTILAPTIIN